MVERDVNHPSILFWDNGNEGGFNTNLDKLFDDFDPQNRRVLHPWASFNGLNTAHYLPYDFVKLACDRNSNYFSQKSLFCEHELRKKIYLYAHGIFARTLRRRRRLGFC